MHGYVELDGQRFTMRAGVHTIRGYSAHSYLLRFVKGIRCQPKEVRLVHGDESAKVTAAAEAAKDAAGI